MPRLLVEVSAIVSQELLDDANLAHAGRVSSASWKNSGAPGGLAPNAALAQANVIFIMNLAAMGGIFNHGMSVHQRPGHRPAHWCHWDAVSSLRRRPPPTACLVPKPGPVPTAYGPSESPSPFQKRDS